MIIYYLIYKKPHSQITVLAVLPPIRYCKWAFKNYIDQILDSFCRLSVSLSFNFQGPLGQNDSENVPTHISAFIIANYDILAPNGTILLKT